MSLLIVCAAVPAQQVAPTSVRVAVVAPEDFREERDRFERLFAHVSEREPALQFQLAIGSYGETLHWLEHGLVDVAVLTPGAFASLLAAEGSDPPTRLAGYIASLVLEPAETPWASEARRRPGNHITYQSACVVSQSSPIGSIDDIRSMNQAGQVEFVFVNPLSVSGCAAPRWALRAAGISPDRVVFSYSHSESIRMLASAPDGVERVAFVWDDAAADDIELASSAKPVAFPELAALMIPHDVVVARHGFPATERLQSLLQDADFDDTYHVKAIEDWEIRFREIRNWLDALDNVGLDLDGDVSSLDEIGRRLLHYDRTQPQAPRLALVLSGGGAKCSYQVGAVGAIEEHLERLRRENPDARGLDIALVVGTSGGAINSLPVAMGISGSDAGREDFAETWRSLDQRDIVRPSFAIRLNMGLWFALIQMSLVAGIMRLVFRDDGERRRRILPNVCLVLAVIQLFGASTGILPLFGRNHLWHHLLLWLGFGADYGAWCLAAFALIARYRARQTIGAPRRAIRLAFAAGLFGLPLLQLVTILAYEPTLSQGVGMEQALADKFPRMIDRHLERNSQSRFPNDAAASPAAQMQAAGRVIVERELIARDLVITGSCLSQTSEDLPSDLYFFLPAPGGSSPAFGDRGVSLSDRPEVLLDVIMGSGSIFPVFPPRVVEGIPEPGERIELVDGGFAHNSPLEAAVLWGATHVVLIEASPRREAQRGSFVKNATSSFRHLHRQAQLLDARSRGKVVVFTLAPEPPHVCVLDFAENLVDDSIRRGRRDAELGPAESPRFRKEFGEPVFTAVGPASQ